MLEGFHPIPRHGEMYLMFCVVPIESDANVSFSGPISGDRVVLLENGSEVICMFAPGVFDAEVVHHKGKLDGTLFVAPKAGCGIELVVACLIEAFLQEFVG